VDYKIPQAPRGTRVLLYESAERYRKICNVLVQMAEVYGANEILLPILDTTVFYRQGGEEALRHLYSFPEPISGRSICLRPDGTITCRMLADTLWKNRRDVKVFYITKCWRKERPQLGRFYEFTQFGVEVLNPRRPDAQPEIMLELATRMVTAFTTRFEVDTSVTHGYRYYTGPGFSINCESLGSRRKVCAGGPYLQGYGFAFTMERLMLILENGHSNGAR
jgi:histidyl-tRNA synthetase